MIRSLAAAALCAAAGCQTPAAPAAGGPASLPTGNRAPVERAGGPDALQDAGSPPDLPRALLAAARERRLRIGREKLQPAADTAALAADALACAAEAHRSWAAQFPEAAAAAIPMQRIGPAGAEALYLEAVCTAIAARMQGFTPLIEKRVQLTEALLRVAQLAPDLDGAGAERELGALYAALPAHAGGDLDEARKHLLAALERAPQDARNHLVLARAVAVKAQDRALFREHVEAAAKSPDAAVAAQAEGLLQREDELFGAPE